MVRTSRSKILLISVLVSAATWFICDHVRISPTKSVGYRFFLKTKLDKGEKVTRNEYVAFDHWVPEGKIIHELKKVVCLPGDELHVTDEGIPGYFCKGEFFGRAKLKTPSGKPLTIFRYNGRVPEGQYFVFGAHENSYDSRYYGFIDGSSFTEKLWPVL